MSKRFWEIDFSRGIAVILMIIFNYSFALDYLGIYRVTDEWLFWWLFPRIVASMFILLAGTALSISYSRNSNMQKHLRRGGKIFGCGIAITVVTWLAIPQDAIWFGILHFIGLSIIISVLFMKMNSTWITVIAAASIAVGAYLSSITAAFPWLLWLGIMPQNFVTLDYFPLMPWLGVFLFGIILGRKYTKKKPSNGPAIARQISFLGRHSLFIYLLHQVLLVAVLFAAGMI